MVAESYKRKIKFVKYIDRSNKIVHILLLTYCALPVNDFVRPYAICKRMDKLQDQFAHYGEQSLHHYPFWLEYLC